ncbi:hypothetical protein CWI37_2206p0010 [Hamiltosporidium tvaerminnensis]|uniref:Uncharacterized protein n=1 Tax=Hamiltosporidium tvaerminnensis TaxID=1176355 RepID=A0A4Q9KTL1_9MICR|nr:hypothetical protein CWI37_2206p0010 [Hamiltosporidium tvaerminnensis]
MRLGLVLMSSISSINKWFLERWVREGCLGRKVESEVNISEVFIFKSKLICRYKNTILNKKK